MTEEEAKTKWCPHMSQQMMGFQHLLMTGQINHSEQELSASCIASECMMWKDSDDNYDYPEGGHCGLSNV